MKKLGIIAAPGWFDPTLKEFSDLHASELEVTQTILPPAGFDYSFEAIEHSAEGLLIAAQQLSAAGCDLIIQVGPAFAYLAGGSAEGARALERELSERCGVTVILNGVAVLDALDDLGAKNLTMSCPYYDAEWKAVVGDFFEKSGYHITAFETFVEQGLFPNQDLVSARGYQFTDEEVIESVKRCCAASTDSDAVLIGGSGVRSLRWKSQLQEDVGLPMVPADFALYQRVVSALDLNAERLS